MKTLEQFKNENQSWLESVISDYVNEMEWQEGMNSHSSDYFTDTRYILIEKLEELNVKLNSDDLNDLQKWLESEIISRLNK
ncbi:MAG: hypothetical protein WC554_01930 [Clostridia bacterium]